MNFTPTRTHFLIHSIVHLSVNLVRGCFVLKGAGGEGENEEEVSTGAVENNSWG